METYGIYRKWESESKELPRFVERALRIPAVVDIEFGYTVRIKGGKNKQLNYCINHPGIRDDQGRVRRPFDGSVYVKTNDWTFYLGDTIWDPIEDKLGRWRMTLELDGKTVADKTFTVIPETDVDH